MQIVINIDKKLYEGIERRDGGLETEYVCDELMKAVDNGTLLPKGITNGGMIKVMFPKLESIETIYVCGMSYVRVIFHGMSEAKIFDLKWWNAPYKAGDETDADYN